MSKPAKCYGPGSIGDRLCKALGAPPRTKSLRINLEIGRLVEVTAEFYPSQEAMENAFTELRRYRLHETAEDSREGDGR